MFCKHCGTQLSANTVFCSNCGAKIATETAQTTENTPTSPVKSTKKRWIVVVAVLCVIALGVGLFFVLGNPFNDDENDDGVGIVEGADNEDEHDDDGDDDDSAKEKQYHARVTRALKTLNERTRFDFELFTEATSEGVHVEDTTTLQADLYSGIFPLCQFRTEIVSEYDNRNVSGYYKNGYAYFCRDQIVEKSSETVADFGYIGLLAQGLIDPETDLHSAAMSKGEDGTLYVSLTIDGDRFGDFMYAILKNWECEYDVESEEGSACTVELVISKDDVITQMKYTCDVPVTSRGDTMLITMECTATYHPVDDSFAVVFPESLEFVRGEAVSGLTFVGTNGDEIVTADDVEYVAAKEENDETMIEIVFTEEGRQRLADYTTTHVGSQMSMMVDGVVAMSSYIDAPLTDDGIIIPFAALEKAQELFRIIATIE